MDLNPGHSPVIIRRTESLLDQLFHRLFFDKRKQMYQPLFSVGVFSFLGKIFIGNDNGRKNLAFQPRRKLSVPNRADGVLDEFRKLMNICGIGVAPDGVVLPHYPDMRGFIRFGHMTNCKTLINPRS